MHEAMEVRVLPAEARSWLSQRLTSTDAVTGLLVPLVRSPGGGDVVTCVERTVTSENLRDFESELGPGAYDMRFLSRLALGLIREQNRLLFAIVDVTVRLSDAWISKLLPGIQATEIVNVSQPYTLLRYVHEPGSDTSRTTSFIELNLERFGVFLAIEEGGTGVAWDSDDPADLAAMLKDALVVGARAYDEAGVVVWVRERGLLRGL